MGPVVLVAAGGVLGAAVRYAAGRLQGRLGAVGFPWATWAVNVAGCFLYGLLRTWPPAAGEAVTLFGRVGFVGALTTFSSLSYETAALGRQRPRWLAGANLGLNLTMGLAALWLGERVGQTL